jgi:predicted anti-sigma-YlaC factor YlaD
MAQDLAGETSPDITCREVAEWTSAYLEAHVDDPTKIRIARHLAACAGCDAYVQQIATVRDLLERLPKAEIQPARRDHVRQEFSARPNRNSPIR